MATAAQAQDVNPLLFRTPTGVNNNLGDPDLGESFTNLLTTANRLPGDTTTFASDPTVGYVDGFQQPVSEDMRGSAREISNIVVQQPGPIPSGNRLSSWIWQWGQLLDHDLDLTAAVDATLGVGDFDITVPDNDPVFPPGSTIDLRRFVHDPTTGTGPGNPRLHPNELTHFVDGSMLYGSTDERVEEKRDPDRLTDPDRRGRMKVHVPADGSFEDGTTHMLPLNDPNNPFPNERGPGGGLIEVGEDFLAGDVRANEQIGLTAAHTLLLREHNRLADAIREANPDLTDDEIFNRARAVMGAKIQAITYNEWLPTLMGAEAFQLFVGDYQGYDPNTDPRVTTAFSTAGFRVGHTMLPPELLRLNDDGTPIAAGALPLNQAFFNPFEIIDFDTDASVNGGVDPYLRGFARQIMQEIDQHIVEDVRSFLFDAVSPGVPGGFDLAAINMQRARDLGLTDYNTMRTEFGLERYTDFSQITSNPELQMLLMEAYDGNIDNIDPWLGMLSEDHLPGSNMGELLNAIIGDQFRRARDGDRFYFENDPFLNSEEGEALLDSIGLSLNSLRQTTLSDLLRANVAGNAADFFQTNAFIVQQQIPAPASGLLLGLGLALLRWRKRM